MYNTPAGPQSQSWFCVFNTPHDCVNGFLKVNRVHVVVDQTLPSPVQQQGLLFELLQLGPRALSWWRCSTDQILNHDPDEMHSTGWSNHRSYSWACEHMPGPRDVVRNTATDRPRLPRRARPCAGTQVCTPLDETRCSRSVCKVRSWWLSPFLASGLFRRINVW